MILRVVVKPSSSESIGSHAEYPEIYHFDSSELSRESDFLDASSVTNTEAETILEIGEWQTWEKFCNCISKLKIQAASPVLIDIPIESFPDLGNTTLLVAPQMQAATLCLKAICEFIPLIEADLSRVYVRVE